MQDETYLRDSDNVLPRILPANWKEMPHNPVQRRWLIQSLNSHPISVIAGVERHAGWRWIHLSLARSDRLPSWDELKDVKRVVIGPNRQAIQVLPKESKYVNRHPFCLHLYACIDEDPIPNFVVDGLI